MNRIGSVTLCALLAAVGCGPVEDFDREDHENVARARQKLVADDLYAMLRQLEFLLPPPPESETVAMGSWTPGGSFVGTASDCTIVYFPVKQKNCVPPTVDIHAINAVLSFDVPFGVTLTVDGRTVASKNGKVEIDVGQASTVNWTLRSGMIEHSDTVVISRKEVGGVGAFTLAALPVTIVYDPPQNQARTNSASQSFTFERTIVESITSGKGTASAPEWAEGQVAKDIGAKLAAMLAKKIQEKHDIGEGDEKKAIDVLEAIEDVWGKVETEVTHATEVNEDKTLSVKIESDRTFTSSTSGGPGHGDIIVFYKDVRLAWGMDQGRVSLTMIDHGDLAMLTVDTLKADLAAVKAGGTAPASGLDAETLTGLIELDPMASISTTVTPPVGGILEGVTLPASRFVKHESLIVNGTDYQESLSHTISESDKVSKESTTTTVTDYHPGWLSLLGLGQKEAGKETTVVKLGSSRTTTSSQTKTASVKLSANGGEVLKLEVNYDNIFGTFLVRTPPPPPPVIDW